jgi:hypothetical protein
LNFPLFSNKNSPQPHTKSEFGMLGIAGKLVKDVVHSHKRKKRKKIIFLLTGCPNSNRPEYGREEF